MATESPISIPDFLIVWRGSAIHVIKDPSIKEISSGRVQILVLGTRIYSEKPPRYLNENPISLLLSHN